VNRRAIGFGAAVLLAAAGWVAASRWSGHRIAACEQRSVRSDTADAGARCA
jgi:hypothetical protein